MSQVTTIEDVSSDWDIENGRKSLMIHNVFQAYSNIWTFGKYEGADKQNHDGILLFHPDTPKATIDKVRLAYLKCANAAKGTVKKLDQIYKPKIADKMFDNENYFGIFWSSSPDKYPAIVTGMEAIDNSEQSVANMKNALANGCMLNVKITFNGDATSVPGKVKVWVNLIAIQYNSGEPRKLGSSGPSEEEIVSGFGKVTGGLASVDTKAGGDDELSLDGPTDSLGTDDDIPMGETELSLDLEENDGVDLDGGDGAVSLDLDDSDDELTL